MKSSYSFENHGTDRRNLFRKVLLKDRSNEYDTPTKDKPNATIILKSCN